MSDGFYEALALWSQVFGSIAFIIVLVWLFNRFVRPAIAAAQQRSNAELAEAERRRDAAKDLVGVAQAELDAAGADVGAIARRAQVDAARERERILADANAEGERLVRNAEGELGRARVAAKDALRAELIARAVQIARESAAKLDAQTNERIVHGVVGTIEREGRA